MTGLIFRAGTTLAIAFATSGLADAQNVVIRWNDAALTAIRATGANPPIASRALAMMHTAMFDAWVAYDADAMGTRLGAGLRQADALRTAANKAQAISFAAYRVLLDVFPTQSSKFTEVMQTLGYDPSITD